jgi:hypothetical protein
MAEVASLKEESFKTEALKKSGPIKKHFFSKHCKAATWSLVAARESTLFQPYSSLHKDDHL